MLPEKEISSQWKYSEIFLPDIESKHNACIEEREQKCMRTTRSKKYALTRDSHTIAPIQWVPYHGPIGYGNKGFWKVFGVGGECGQRHTRAAQNHGLET